MPARGGTPSQSVMYQKIASRADEIVDELFELLHSRNENIRMGAAKVLANKIIPDRKAVEVSGENGGPIKVNIIRDYLSESVADAASERSLAGQVEIQSVGVAPESKENINSTGEDSVRSVQPAP